MAKPKKPLSFDGADEMMAREITLIVDNDPFLEGRRKREFRLNQLRKLKSGKYDFDKSIRLWRYLADEGDKAMRAPYRRGYDGMTYPDTSKVQGYAADVPTRNLAARMFAEEFRDEAALTGPDMVAPYGGYTWLALQEGILKPPKKKATKKKATKKKATKKKATKKKATKKRSAAAAPSADAMEYARMFNGKK